MRIQKRTAFRSAYRSISSTLFIRATFILLHTILKPIDLKYNSARNDNSKVHIQGKNFSWRHWGK